MNLTETKTITQSQVNRLKEIKKSCVFTFRIIEELVKEAEQITGDKEDYMFEYLWNEPPMFGLSYYLNLMGISVLKGPSKQSKQKNKCPKCSNCPNCKKNKNCNK